MQKQKILVKKAARTASVVRVGRNFQITIPAEIRKFVPLSEGDFVETSTENGQIVFTPVVLIKKALSRDKENKEWSELILKHFLDGYDPADSAYDKL